MSETPRSQLPRQIYDPTTVALAVRLLEEERAACPSCQKGTPVAHARSYERDGVLYQSPCASFNRVFDPAIGAFVGHTHCTCDFCW